MLHFDEGNSAWNQFVRGYSEDLDTLVYSTLVAGDWDPGGQQGAGNTRLYDLVPVAGGVLALGIHEERVMTAGLQGNPVPPASVFPSWGTRRARRPHRTAGPHPPRASESPRARWAARRPCLRRVAR